jgi:FkbM family methyltransferase
MTNDLIYDVGMYDGYDTAYYLTCGFRVIAIEANPSLVALAQKRFEAEIEAGKLTIINVGISDHSTVAEFWVSDELPAVSTFSKDLTTRFNVPHHPIQVQCKPLSEIVSEYGVPYYLKIDIEDYDIVCLNQLTLATKPTFISVEMTSEESGGQLLVRLRELRYDRFKIINQRHLLPIGGQQMGLRGKFFWTLYRLANHRIDIRALPFRVVRGATAGILHFATSTGLWGVSAYRSRLMPAWRFKQGSSSGSFGEDLPGKWFTYEEIVAQWTGELAVCRGTKQIPWHDLHAATSATLT